MNEIWYKTSNPEYFANHQGQIKTFDRCEYMPYKTGVRKITRKGRLLKPIKMNNGYLYVDFSSRGTTKRMSVHRIMAQTFLEVDIENKHIHHIDENKENNSLNNLQIIDAKLHCSQHNFKREFENQTGYRNVHIMVPGRYRGSIQRSGKRTIYTKIYDDPKEAYDEVKTILQSMNQ